jgi:hypothetical protein
MERHGFIVVIFLFSSFLPPKTAFVRICQIAGSLEFIATGLESVTGNSPASGVTLWHHA